MTIGDFERLASERVVRVLEVSQPNGHGYHGVKSQ
jgi:hypothetical protein